MMGCLERWKCLVACLFLEESQQPTWPQVRQIRRCSHSSPLLRHSSQPLALGVTLAIVFRCEQKSLFNGPPPPSQRKRLHTLPLWTGTSPANASHAGEGSLCSLAMRRLALTRQEGMDGRDHCRTLAHRRRYALHRAAAHIAHRKDAVAAGCQEMG